MKNGSTITMSFEHTNNRTNISKCFGTITRSIPQMPLNCFDVTYRGFEQQVLPELQRRGIAALGMKSLGATASRSNTASWRRKRSCATP
jgi:hypothetical protein